jgi:hypothetical protein
MCNVATVTLDVFAEENCWMNDFVKVIIVYAAQYMHCSV